MDNWLPLELTTYQDHVIAHVIGARILGHFIADESLHLLLDMRFIWTVYLDAQMALLPSGVAVDELSISDELRDELKKNIDALAQADKECVASVIIPAAADVVIEEVNLYENDYRRRIDIIGAHKKIQIETSLTSSEIEVSYLERRNTATSNHQSRQQSDY